MKNFKNLYFSNRFWTISILLIFVFILGALDRRIAVVGSTFMLLFFGAVLVDIFLLFGLRNPIAAHRHLTEKLSNGDLNRVKIEIFNHTNSFLRIEIIDELPEQFQIRNFSIKSSLSAQQIHCFEYEVRPTTRGEYFWGTINLFIQSHLGLAIRRIRIPQIQKVAVYPSFLQMRKYELLAISNKLVDAGLKKIRKISNTHEFEEIKEYTQGDDYRSINWKATARKAQLMSNRYRDEKAQQVFCVIDMGRTMQSSFLGLTLLEYAINASLVISNVALQKHDRVGLLTFNQTIDTFLKADRKNRTLQTILDLLYYQHTSFFESNFDLMFASIRNNVKQRSLLILFTNFEGLSSAQNKMPNLRHLSKNHVVLVIFFENVELNETFRAQSNNSDEFYLKAIAEKFILEKKQIVKELNLHGIYALLTEPQHLTVNLLNKYLEFKSKGII